MPSIAAPWTLTALLVGSVIVYFLVLALVSWLGPPSSTGSRFLYLRIDSETKAASGLLASIAIALTAYGYFIEQVYRTSPDFEMKCVVDGATGARSLVIRTVSPGPLIGCKTHLEPRFRNRSTGEPLRDLDTYIISFACDPNASLQDDALKLLKEAGMPLPDPSVYELVQLGMSVEYTPPGYRAKVSEKRAIECRP